MKRETLSVTYSRKVNLGNYESLDATCFQSVTLEEGDCYEEVLKQITSEVKEAVYNALESELKDSNKVLMKKLVTGKEVETKVKETKKQSLELPDIKKKEGNTSKGINLPFDFKDSDFELEF